MWNSPGGQWQTGNVNVKNTGTLLVQCNSQYAVDPCSAASTACADKNGPVPDPVSPCLREERTEEFTQSYNRIHLNKGLYWYARLGAGGHENRSRCLGCPAVQRRNLQSKCDAMPSM